MPASIQTANTKGIKTTIESRSQVEAGGKLTGLRVNIYGCQIFNHTTPPQTVMTASAIISKVPFLKNGRWS